MERSKFKSLVAWKRRYPAAFRTAKELGIIQKICDSFGWKNELSSKINYDEIWEQNFLIVKKHLEENKEFSPKKNKLDKINILSWCVSQSYKYRTDSLTEYRKNKLKTIKNWRWHWSSNINFSIQFSNVLEYLKEYGKFPEPHTSLGKWLKVQRNTDSIDRHRVLYRLEGWAMKKIIVLLREINSTSNEVQSQFYDADTKKPIIYKGIQMYFDYSKGYNDIMFYSRKELDELFPCGYVFEFYYVDLKFQKQQIENWWNNITEEEKNKLFKDCKITKNNIKNIWINYKMKDVAVEKLEKELWP